MINSNQAWYIKEGDPNFAEVARWSFSQETHTRRKERIMIMKNALDESLISNNDNPFVINDKRKMIVNMNKIIPRSLSEEKARSKIKSHHNHTNELKENK